MSAGSKSGKDCKVAIGTASVIGMGTWNLNGISSEEFENSEFGDNWKTYEFGMKDGGSVTFNGLYKPTDETGQQALLDANLENTDLTTLRLYIDNTSYFEPCQTTGYFSPYNTTGASTKLSHVNVTALDISADKSGLMQISFTCRVSGVMVLK